MKYLMLMAIIVLSACAQDASDDNKAVEADAALEQHDADALDSDTSSGAGRLEAILAAQPSATRDRYSYRHPQETLEFFGVEQGMTVVDVLPGQAGWYAPILVDYLGADGKLIGADYALEMWPMQGPWANAEYMENRKTWTDQYIEAARSLRGDDSAAVDAFVFGSVPERLAGSVDVVLMFRALHPFVRTEGGRFLRAALEDMKGILKPGGIVGVVQHRAPENLPDEWALGYNGYVKQSKIISMFTDSGFELLGTSEINANPMDRPTEEDQVWRLPPTLRFSRDDPELNAAMLAIGESDRMTLKFRRPD